MMPAGSAVRWTKNSSAPQKLDHQSPPPLPPVYEIREIVNYLHEALPVLRTVTDEDIARPTCERLYPIYRALIQMTLSVPDASLDQLPFDAQAGESDPELFRDACPKLILFKLMNSFINDISANQIDFTLTDILAPQQKKSVQILSLLIDFWEHLKFREERSNKIFQEFDERALRREQLKQNLIELKEKSNKKRSEMKGKDHLTSKKREELQQLTNQIAQLKAKSEKHESEIGAVESNLRSEAAVIKELSDQLAHLKAEDGHLAQKIVTSPERLHQEIGELDKTKSAAKQQTQELRAQLAEMTTREEELATVDHHLETMMSDLNSIVVAKDKMVEKQNQMELLMARRKEVHTRLLSEKKELEQCRLDLQNKGNAFDRLARKHQAALADIVRQRDHLKMKVEQMREKYGQNEVVREDVLQQIRKEKDELAGATRQYECELMKLDESFKQFQNKHEEVARKLNEWLAEGFSDMQELDADLHCDSSDVNDDVGVPEDPVSGSSDESALSSSSEPMDR